MTDTATGPFRLDEARARKWLEAVVAFNEHQIEMPREFENYNPGIDLSWKTEHDMESATWWELPYEAWQLGVITGPAELFLWIDQAAGDYHVAYQPWGRQGSYVAGHVEEMRRIGERQAAPGVEGGAERAARPR